MNQKRFAITAKIWIYSGENASWHFLTIPKDVTLLINKKFAGLKRGWGSLPVEATLGKTIWKTSIFPDTKSRTYILPLKALVRRQEGIEAGDQTAVTITILP